ELRENAGELEAARKGELPRLVELKDVRGDLHSHTTWSDGRETLEQMVLGARARGYEYLAVTDHPRSTLAEQNLEIDVLNERLKPFRILKGIETGTSLEINSQPNRLDLRDTHARLAGEAGVKIVVNTDAHQLSALAHVEMGLAQARRAWLTKEQVLNTRTWPQIEKLLK